MVIAILLKLGPGNLRKRAKAIHAKASVHKIPGDGNLTDLWIKVHLELGTQDLANGWYPREKTLGLLQWCTSSLYS